MWLNTLELQSSGSCGCWVSLQATQPQSPWLWECHLWAILSLVFGPEKFHVEKQEKRKDIHSSCGHKKLLSHNFEIDLYMRTSLQCASALRMLVLAFQAITSYNVNGSYDAIGLSGFDGKWWSKIAYILIRFIECIWFFNLFGLEVGQVLRAAGCSLMMYYMSCTRNAMRSALQPCLAYWRSFGGVPATYQLGETQYWLQHCMSLPFDIVIKLVHSNHSALTRNLTKSREVPCSGFAGARCPWRLEVARDSFGA